MRLGLALTLLTLSLSVFAQEKDFSSWTKFTSAKLVSETTSWTPGSQAALGFKINFVPHWHTYWVNAGDSGNSIRLNFKTPEGVRIRKVDHPTPTRILTGPLISFAYENEVLLPIDVELDQDLKIGDKVAIELDAEWLVCSEVCIPAFQSFKFEIPLTSLEEIKQTEEFALFQKSRANVPVASEEVTNYDFTGAQPTLTIASGLKGAEFVEFFPFKNSGVNNEKPKVVSQDPLKLEFEKSNVPQADAKRVGVLVMKTGTQTQVVQIGDSGWTFNGGGSAAEGADQSLWWMLLSAFLGGLILNLMPCVFPILSIKLLSLLKLSHENPREVRRQNLAYVGGVLASFLAIALAISALRSAGDLVGWGFQLQSPVFLAFLIWLFFAMSLNLLGFFEIDIIDLNLGHQLTMRGGVSGSFFTGVLAVIVASPCTAPFMGVALGFGLSQSIGVLFAVFLSLGLGLAFPYLLFAIFPSWAKVLPRPGLWMKYLKQVMALPLLATAVWLFWILSQMRGTSTLGVVLAGSVLLLFSLWFGKKRIIGIVTVLVLMCGLAFVYRDQPVIAEAKTEGPWLPFTEERLQSLKGKNILVDMTADWCLTCKVNERLVLDQPEVQELFKRYEIVLIKGDWTNRNPEITRFLNRYQRVGVPFYVLYSSRHPDGLVLPEVLSKTSFMEQLAKEFAN